tara:strand:+ start:556 stop:2877 length:2322 start_codon:yes stop_codon:yes gene_type:complete
MLGVSVPRREDQALLTGRGRFIDDAPVADELHVLFLRSPVANARIASIDIEAAIASDGVVAVFVGDDIAADGQGLMQEGCALTWTDGRASVNPAREAMVREQVRFVGDTVAMVVATTIDGARDGLELIAVEYAEEDAAADISAAIADDAPVVWPEAPDNVALHWHGGDAAETARAFAQAHASVSVRLVNNRVVIAPMETRGVRASYDAATDTYTVVTPSQGVGGLRNNLAREGLRVDTSRVRVITENVGGAFGIKIPVYAEHVLMAWASRKLGRSLRWIAERGDAFLTDGAGRDHIMTGELAFTADGTFKAVRCTGFSNMGAYASGAAPVIPTAGGSRCITGVYAIPAWHADIKVVFSHTTPILAYRGAGKPEYNYLIERLVDAAAERLGISPSDLRTRNAVAPSQLPYTTGTGLLFDSGEFAANLERVRMLADAETFEERREAAAARGYARGLGFAMFQEPDGYLDNRVTLVFDVDCTLSITVTGQDSGHGHATTFAQVAADTLGIHPDKVKVVQGDTLAIGPGSGSGGSRTATVASMGIVNASREIIEKGKRLTAHHFEAAVADIEFANGEFGVVGTDQRLPLANVVAGAFAPRSLPADEDPGLEASCHYLAREYNYPCGAHACELEVDKETGIVNMWGYWAVNDHGEMINPMLLEGQVHGGVVQGIGQALLEDCRYEDGSAQLLSGSFMDYCLPRAEDLPTLNVEFAPTRCRTNVLGVKGVGESGCTAAPPAVMNALLDALRPLGVQHVDMPATPERVWQAIQAAQPGGS